MEETQPLSVETVRPLLERIYRQYALDWWGLHGISHWARVYESGLRLVPDTQADRELVLLFTLFHDAGRTNEGWDHGHGLRGAELAASLRQMLHLSPPRFELLYYACEKHTDGLTDADPTVQTCWDADRLDLPRAGIQPRPERLCTPAARSPEVLAWATGRSERRVIPGFIQREWAIPEAGAPSGGWES